MSLVSYFFVQCRADRIATIESSVREVYPRLQFERTEVMAHPDFPKPNVDGVWFHAHTGVGEYRQAAESEIAKRLYSLPDVLELRWSTDMILSDSGNTEIVTNEHRLIMNNGLEFSPRSWMVDENGQQLLDHAGKPLDHLDYPHKRMALLAQAFNATDGWLSDEQWSAIDEWINYARLGGIK